MKGNAVAGYLKKTKLTSLFSALIVSSLFLTGCGDSEEDGSDYSFRYTLSSNPANLDPQIATDASSVMIIKNMFLGLMKTGNDGNIEYGVAKSHTVSDDGLTYSFILRDDCHWYSADGTEDIVTAHDFVYAFKRIFDPVTRSPYREKFSFLKNAQAIIDGEEEYSKLGVYAVNNTELVFHLDRRNSEFLYLLTTAPAMPCHKQFFESTKARYGLDDESVISNGAFYMTQWSYDPYGNDNLIYMKRNYDNSQYDKVYPYMLTFTIDRDSQAPSENFNASKTDCFVSENAQKKAFIDFYNTQKYETKSAGIIFNSEYDIDDDIKRALSLSIDREELSKAGLDSFDIAYGIVPGGMYRSGINFRERFADSELDFYSTELPEMTEDDINRFYEKCPEDVRILVDSKSDDGIMSRVVAEWKENLGLYIGIDYTDEETYLERLMNGDYFMAFAEISSEDSSVYYFLKNVSEFAYSEYASDILDFSLGSDDDDEIMRLYMEAENEIISTGNYIPLFYKKTSLISRKNVRDIIFDPFSKAIDFRYSKYFG